MTYVYIALGVLAGLMLITILVTFLRRGYARRLVQGRTDCQKCCELNTALEPFGFGYDLRTDNFFSLMYPWQRELGYCRFYDEAAPMLSMVIDSEPIYFQHAGRNFLLEVWKGQYGLTTGAEIGFYVSAETGKQPEELFYDSVSDEERLDMSFVLRKAGRVLLERRATHWWLTGFVLGEFSHRGDLSMEVRIDFPNEQMQVAFVGGLMRAGYERENIWVDRNTVSFFFNNPRSRQPKYRTFQLWRVQNSNRRNCRRYLRLTRFFTRTIDRVDYLSICFPRLYRAIIRMGRYRSLVIASRRYARYKRRQSRRNR